MLASSRKSSGAEPAGEKKMTKTAYEDRRFAAKTRRVIEQANEIMDEYGGSLTLRQLHYQFVARDLYENTQRNYKKLGDIIRNGRMAGLVDWDSIEDRTRSLYGKTTYGDPSEPINSLQYQYAEDLWRDQPVRLEVWIEKNALTGVISPATSRNRIDYFPTIGYPSISALKEAATRLNNYNNPPSWKDEGTVPQKVVILYLSDHDPEGMQMPEKVEETLATMGVENFEVKRIGLTLDQVREFNPPPSFAKETSARYTEYVRRYGTDQAWELDALQPDVIQALIQEQADHYRDVDLWEIAVENEEASRERIKQISNNYIAIIDWLTEDDDDDDY